MRRLVTLFVTAAFVVGATGLALGQTGTAGAVPVAPAEKAMVSRTASGKVKSASADSLVVTGKARGKDAEWTFALDAKTKIKKGGKDATAADLKAGDAVSVRYMEQEGKNVAQGVMARAEASRKAEGKTTADKTEQPVEKKQ